jgi:uncharacterized protein (DUF983 family)
MNSQAKQTPLTQSRPGLVKMLFRGLLKRCAWCGGKRAFFTGFYKKGERCITCGLSWQRNLEGFELGAAAMGVFLTFGPIILWMIFSVIFGVALVPLLVVAAGLAIFVPILAYPLTYTVWFAVYLYMNEPEPAEREEAAQWCKICAENA